jgi:hypothetical protein
VIEIGALWIEQPVLQHRAAEGQHPITLPGAIPPLPGHSRLVRNREEDVSRATDMTREADCSESSATSVDRLNVTTRQVAGAWS